MAEEKEQRQPAPTPPRSNSSGSERSEHRSIFGNFRETIATLNHLSGLAVIITAVFSSLTASFYSLSFYRKDCIEKGHSTYFCFGGYIGQIDIPAIDKMSQDYKASMDETRQIRTNNDELKKQIYNLEKSNKQTIDKIQSALDDTSKEVDMQREAIRRRDSTITDQVEAIRSRDTKIADLERSLAKLPKSPPDEKPKSTIRPPSNGNSHSKPPSPPTRPDPHAVAAGIWPEGSVSAGSEVSATTPHGIVSCIGGNNITGAPRRCRWK